MSSTSRILRTAIAASVAVTAAQPLAAQQFFGPTAYLRFSDRPAPFQAPGFSYYHLETFEDHVVNAPGLTATGGGVTSVVFGPAIHDSVDEDDGVVDGSGLNGDSYFGGSTFDFSFSAGLLGALPTHAGLVWTDGGGTYTFEAFGAGGQSLGAFAAILGDGSVSGTTAEDRFLGVSVDGASGGISRIRISGSTMEVDHVQYGRLAGTPPISNVPEPSTYALLAGGLAVLLPAARRRYGSTPNSRAASRS